MLTTARGLNENSELYIEDIDAHIPSKSKIRQKKDSKLLIPPLNVGKIKTSRLDDYIVSSDDDQDADISSIRDNNAGDTLRQVNPKSRSKMTTGLGLTTAMGMQS
jgi:hypothetical protein